MTVKIFYCQVCKMTREIDWDRPLPPDCTRCEAQDGPGTGTPLQELCERCGDFHGFDKTDCCWVVRRFYPTHQNTHAVCCPRIRNE